MSLYTHWVCLDCRKSFHKKPSDLAWKCPDCAKPMTDMGIYFEPPKRQALKKWQIIRLLAERNYKFQTEGSKVYIEKIILGEKNPSLKKVKEAI